MSGIKINAFDLCTSSKLNSFWFFINYSLGYPNSKVVAIVLRERDRETERETDRETDRDRERQTETERETERDRER